MTRGDRILVLVIAVMALVAAPLTLALSSGGRGETATIDGPAGKTVVRLDRPALLRVEGRTGTVVVRVEDGKACVTSSDCPDQLCVRSGMVRPGRAAVCAPNGVVVSVGGETDVDAVSR